MAPKTLLACALLACCLVAAHAKGTCQCWFDFADHCCNLHGDRRLLQPKLGWRKGVVTISRVVGCTDEDEGTPCLSIEEVQDAVHNKVVNATVLAVSSSLPDARADAWEGQTLSFFFNDGNSSVSDGTIAPEDVHAVVTHLEYCPLGGGNVLNITARLDAETTFEGAPVRGDLLPGTVVEVLVGHHETMAELGHATHLTAHMGDALGGAEDAEC